MELRGGFGNRVIVACERTLNVDLLLRQLGREVPDRRTPEPPPSSYSAAEAEWQEIVGGKHWRELGGTGG